MSQFVLLEPKNVYEFKELISLRYEHYKSGKQLAFFKDDQYGYDLDYWDRKSIHLGMKDTDSDKFVGYIRMTRNNVTHHASFADQMIAEIDPLHYKYVYDQELQPFPILSYYPGAQDILNSEINGHYKLDTLCSLGKLTIHEAHRSRLVMNKICNAIHACGLKYGFNRCMITCLPNHKIYYEALGFKVLDGPQNIIGKYGEVSQSLLLLLLLQEYLPIQNKS